MKYYLKYPTWIRLTLILLTIACFVLIALNTLTIVINSGIGNVDFTYNITVIVMMIAIIVFCIALLCARYRIVNNTLHLKILGINVLGTVISVDNILNINYNVNTTRLHIGYMLSDSTTNILLVNIVDKAKKPLMEHLKQLNSTIVLTEEK